jgi:hypothetical protein
MQSHAMIELNLTSPVLADYWQHDDKGPAIKYYKAVRWIDKTTGRIGAIGQI